MKAFWIMGFAIALSGCAAPPATTIAASSFTAPANSIALVSGRDCGTWRVLDGVAVCKADPAALQSAGARAVPALYTERPQEIVGSEAHHLVLDGAS